MIEILCMCFAIVCCAIAKKEMPTTDAFYIGNCIIFGLSILGRYLERKN